MKEKLNPAEEDIMRIIWQEGEANVRVYLDKLKKPMPYTTLASIIKNLERKNYLTSRRIGNVILYRPNGTEQEYKKTFLNNIVQDYFSNSYKQLVNFFVDEKKISPAELKAILKIIESKK